MAVITKFRPDGEFQYQSAAGGVIPKDEMESARRLNKLIKKSFKEVIERFDLKALKKSKLSFYWSIGDMLGDIISESSLVAKNEIDLFYINVRIHMDSYGNLFPKDDLKKRRNIPKQLHLLSEYPYAVASELSWTQWSYLFDNTYIINNTGFHNWFSDILQEGKYEFSEGFLRLWAESFNLLFNKVDLTDWTKEDFLKSLFSTLNIVQTLKKSGYDINSREERKKIKKELNNILKKKRREFIQLQKGSITEKEYVNLICDEVREKIPNE